MEIERKNKRKKSMKEGGKDEKQRGVWYLGRIPPRMDPSTLRQMLSQYGEIQGLYLAHSSGHVQIKAGGKKRSSFYYDLWNIKYLSKFKWDNLTEEIAYKKATREQKLALEISAAKKECDFYLTKVEMSRALSAIDDRLKKRLRVKEDSWSNPNLSDSQPEHQVIHWFHQKKPVANNAAKIKPRLSGDVLSAVSIVLLCCKKFVWNGTKPDSERLTPILEAYVVSESLSSSETKSNEKRVVQESPSTLADRILNPYKPNVSKEFSPITYNPEDVNCIRRNFDDFKLGTISFPTLKEVFLET